MTVVAVWFEPQDDGIWAVADTRISIPSQGGGVVVHTDAASKLFTLSVVCRPIANAEAIFPQPHWTGTFGFAFSGDSLPALMTFSTATSCLANLRSLVRTGPPTLRSIAEVVRKLGTRFGREVAASRNSHRLELEMVVFGWCPVLQRHAVYSLRSSTAADPLSLLIEESFPQTNEEITFLGSRTSEASERIAKLRAQGTTWRTPQLAGREMVTGGSTPDVGGSWSIGFSNRLLGFVHFVAMVPGPGGAPKFFMSLNGIDTEQEIGQVGEYIVGLMAMM